MLTCSNCGATIREGAKFCTACGTRLNDVSSTTSTSVWQQVPAADSPESPTTTAPVDATAQATEVTTETPSSETASTVGSTATTGEDRSAFTWSWGSPVTADTTATSEREEDNEPAPETTEIDEEAGIAVDSSTAASTDASGDTVADATELSVLEDEPDTSDSSAVDSQGEGDDDQPAESAEVDDALLAVAEEESGEEPAGDEGKDSETLAAWAGNWDADDDSDDDSTTGDSTAATEPTTYGAVTRASSTEKTAASATATPAEDETDGDKEDTVTKAERLIGELKALIPAMVRPSPSIPASRANTASLTVASDLENAARVGQFDDVRDVLLAARDNPRDVDNVLKLSANVDRLLELLDDRNNLAKTAESAATRLRTGNTQSGIN